MDLDSLHLNSDCRAISAVRSALYFLFIFVLLIVTVRSQSNGPNLTECSAVISLWLHWIQISITHLYFDKANLSSYVASYYWLWKYWIKWYEVCPTRWITTVSASMSSKRHTRQVVAPTITSQTQTPFSLPCLVNVWHAKVID
jgi:hypothetical protein